MDLVVVVLADLLQPRGDRDDDDRRVREVLRLDPALGHRPDPAGSASSASASRRSYRPTIRDVLDRRHPDPRSRSRRSRIRRTRRTRRRSTCSTAEVLAQVGERLGGQVARPARAVSRERRSFGQQTGELTALLDEPAFIDTFPPPLNDDKLKQLGARSTSTERLSERFDKAKLDLAELRPIEAIGPFLRCRDVLRRRVGVLLRRARHHVPGHAGRRPRRRRGAHLLARRFFDVRWNAGPIPPRHPRRPRRSRGRRRSATSRSSCARNKPAIVTVGLMPLAAIAPQQRRPDTRRA